MNNLKWILPALVLVGFNGCIGGCASLIKNPIQDATSQIITEVVKPVVTKAVEEVATQTAQLQGGVQGINPGIKVSGHVTYGPAVVYDFTVAAEGVAGQLQGSAQGAAKTDPQ